MPTELDSKDGILIRTMTVADYQPLKTLMGGNFFKGEPLGELYEPEWVIKFKDEYYISMIEQGTCLLAVDENNGGRIVGYVLAHAQTPDDLDRDRKRAAASEPNTWEDILVFLSRVDIEVNLFKRYGISELLFSFMTHVVAPMRGKGLGSRLAAALMEIGRKKGFPLMVAQCISYYSARQKEALGMECAYSIAYADYKDESGQVVFKPAAPHTHLRVMVIKL
ncbi:arylalkylamine N-acetyltransferase-like 2 [Drosophila virilis]|uniref:arylalkylamine N-acetyltransferase-like 2 n=1 Tax=Drosophila virilis TaxID=7244 RepID=UPI00139600D9|nr:dopamine N-acetyltransferase [Drosophila virilis]